MPRLFFISLLLINFCFAQTPDHLSELEHYKIVNNPTENSNAVMKSYLNYSLIFSDTKEIDNYFTRDYSKIEKLKVYATKNNGEKILYQEVNFNRQGLPDRVYLLELLKYPVLKTYTYSDNLLTEIKYDNGRRYEVRYDDNKMILISSAETKVFSLNNNRILKNEYSFEKDKEGKTALNYSENKLEGKCRRSYLNDKLLFEYCFSDLDKHLPFYIKYISYQGDTVMQTKQMKVDSVDAYHYKNYFLTSADKLKSVYSLYQDIYLNDKGQFIRIISPDDAGLLEFEYEYYK